MQIDLSFPHYYELEMARELPPTHQAGRVWYYPGARESGKDGLMVRVIPPDAPDWIGIVEPGYRSPIARSGVFSLPDPDCLCVVSSGFGCIIRADSPEKWWEIEAFPITDIRLAREKRLIIFADLTDLVAYGEEGLRWRAEQVSADGIRIGETTSSLITGTAYDAPSGSDVEFQIELESGKLRG